MPIMNHVDVNMFGSLPLELYKITKDQRYLDLGLPYSSLHTNYFAYESYDAARTGVKEESDNFLSLNGIHC